MNQTNKFFSLLLEDDPKKRHKLIKELDEKQAKHFLETCLSALNRSSLSLNKDQFYFKKNDPQENEIDE